MIKQYICWFLSNKWRKWGAVAVSFFGLNYVLLIVGLIEANEFDIITNALVAFLKLFLII
jgi:hypothetical protein